MSKKDEILRILKELQPWLTDPNVPLNRIFQNSTVCHSEFFKSGGITTGLVEEKLAYILSNYADLQFNFNETLPIGLNVLYHDSTSHEIYLCDVIGGAYDVELKDFRLLYNQDGKLVIDLIEIDSQVNIKYFLSITDEIVIDGVRYYVKNYNDNIEIQTKPYNFLNIQNLIEFSTHTKYNEIYTHTKDDIVEKPHRKILKDFEIVDLLIVTAKKVYHSEFYFSNSNVFKSDVRRGDLRYTWDDRNIDYITIEFTELNNLGYKTSKDAVVKFAHILIDKGFKVSYNIGNEEPTVTIDNRNY